MGGFGGATKEYGTVDAERFLFSTFISKDGLTYTFRLRPDVKSEDQVVFRDVLRLGRVRELRPGQRTEHPLEVVLTRQVRAATEHRQRDTRQRPPDP